MTCSDLLRIGETNSRLARYKTKKAKAIEVCREQLRTHSAPYVAISGGKDSVAMSYLVDEAARAEGIDFRLWAHVSDASFPGTVETCQEVAERLGRPLDVYASEQSAFEYVNMEDKRKFGKKGVFFDSIREYARDKDLAFVGVRAGESKRRMTAAKAHGMVFHSADMGDVDVVHPLLWFSIYDVFSVLREYAAPIHPIYSKISVDVTNNANGEPRFIRLGYVTAQDLREKGTVLFIKLNYPELYARLVEACPDVRRFT